MSMKITDLTGHMYGWLKERHPELLPMSVEVRFDCIHPYGTNFIVEVEPVYPRQGNGPFLDFYDVLKIYQSDLKGCDGPVTFDGVNFWVGDGDDSLAVQRLNVSGASIWLRAFTQTASMGEED